MFNKALVSLFILKVVPIAYGAIISTKAEFLSIPVSKMAVPNTNGSDRNLKEDNSVIMKLNNVEDFKYYGEVEVVTPGQKFQVFALKGGI